MNIRPLDYSDLDAVTDLDRLCFPPGIAFPRYLFEQCLADEHCECFGIEAGGRLAAFAIIGFPGPYTINIITIDVHPQHRREGLADTIMAEIFKTARANNTRRIALQASVDNVPAISLYQKHGLSIKATLQGYYGPEKHAYLMDRIFKNQA